MLNNRHKATGEVFPEAVASHGRAQRRGSTAALAAGVRAATDVTGFGLLGHLYKMRARPGSTAVSTSPRCRYSTGRGRRCATGSSAVAPGATSTGCSPHLDAAPGRDDDLLLLADAQTSGGLLVVGEVPGGTVIGELVPRGEHVMQVR